MENIPDLRLLGGVEVPSNSILGYDYYLVGQYTDETEWRMSIEEAKNEINAGKIKLHFLGYNGVIFRFDVIQETSGSKCLTVVGFDNVFPVDVKEFLSKQK